MAAPEPPLVTLNVGGQLFTALRATLRSRPGSLLSAMFSGEWEPTAVRDAGGHPYIDRCGQRGGGGWCGRICGWRSCTETSSLRHARVPHVTLESLPLPKLPLQ